MVHVGGGWRIYTHMRLTRRQLRSVIKEAMDTSSPKQTKQKLAMAVKQFGDISERLNVVAMQLRNVKGWDASMLSQAATDIDDLLDALTLFANEIDPLATGAQAAFDQFKPVLLRR